MIAQRGIVVSAVEATWMALQPRMLLHRLIMPARRTLAPATVAQRGDAWIGYHPLYDGAEILRCPYGMPGDVLWVKEPWCLRPDGFGYRAQHDPDNNPRVWGTASTMPKRAARLFLEIESVTIPVQPRRSMS